jgi:hypothetical protein
MINVRNFPFSIYRATHNNSNIFIQEMKSRVGGMSQRDLSGSHPPRNGFLERLFGVANPGGEHSHNLLGYLAWKY